MSFDHDSKLNLSAGIFSVLVAFVLVMAKLWALGETASLSIAATMADSGLDLLMSLGGLAALAYAAKPADEDHAFGHSAAEDLAALGQSLFILASAFIIAGAAILRLLDPHPHQLTAEARGIGVMVFSIVVTLILIGWQRHVARRTDSRVIKADSLHYVGDLIPNFGAIVALVASSQMNWPRVDSYVALLTAALLAYGALRIGKGAWDALMDRRADPAMIAAIGQIAADFPGVYGYHDLKTRTAGSRVFVNMHIELDGLQSLDDAHAIGAALRRAIVHAYPRADVLIHKDPIGVEPHPDDPRKSSEPR